MGSGTGRSGSRQVGIGELVRLGWMLLGFNGTMLVAVSIAYHPIWTLGWRDAVFWGTVLSTGLLRYLDITRFDGETAGGRPATMRELRRYLIGLVLVSGVAWVASQSVNL